MTDELETLRAEVARLTAERDAAEPVHMFRKVGCSDWYMGLADHEDFGGPYEERTLYAHPAPDTLRQVREALEAIHHIAIDGACATDRKARELIKAEAETALALLTKEGVK